MIILNAGVPRSGTVLVNAIVRELLRSVAPNVVQLNPHGAELVQVVRNLQATGQHIHATYLIHTHSWGPEVSARLAGDAHARTIVNYRDPRDVCVSLMKLHENELGVTMKAVELYFAHMEACARDTGALVLPYELLAAHTPSAIFQIARHLGLWPGLDRVAEIAEATSIDKHRGVMEEVKAGSRDHLIQRQNRKRVLIEDGETLINDRHIQSGRSGRWKTE
ncbi:MAG: sulfotransferase domain-containing protein, partial [Pseudomonadota bacterium]